MNEAHQNSPVTLPHPCHRVSRAVIYAALSFSALAASRGFAQSAPVAPDHPWHSSAEQAVERDATREQKPEAAIDSSTTYSLADLIGFAEEHHPETRVAWERARAQAAALGVRHARRRGALAGGPRASLPEHALLPADDRIARSRSRPELHRP